jgi:hypothetical protein
MLQCAFCGLTFASKRALLRHQVPAGIRANRCLRVEELKGASLMQHEDGYWFATGQRPEELGALRRILGEGLLDGVRVRVFEVGGLHFLRSFPEGAFYTPLRVLRNSATAAAIVQQLEPLLNRAA